MGPVYRDLREHLKLLKEKGLLAEITHQVDIKYECASKIYNVGRDSKSAVLFNNIKNYKDWKIAGGIFSTPELTAIALGIDEKNLLSHYMESLKNPLQPEFTSEAPFTENIMSGKDVDLSKLPILLHAEKDAGPYIFGGVQIAKNPDDNNIRNISIHRMLYLDKDKLSLYALPYRELGRWILKAEERNEGLPVAVAIGVEPSVLIASQAKTSKEIDKFALAGALQQKPVRLTKCRTIDIEVPASSEIVIEGRTIPHERVLDGPCCEYSGCYGAPQKAPVFKVDAIMMRNSPVFHTCLTGFPITENHNLSRTGIEALIWEEIKNLNVKITGINLTFGGTCRRHLVVSIEKRHDEEPRNIIYRLASSMLGIKQVVVVDNDIDIFNPLEVEWAICTRVQPHRDIIIMPPVVSIGLDPSAIKPNTSSVWGIDATMPLSRDERFERVRFIQ